MWTCWHKKGKCSFWCSLFLYSFSNEMWGDTLCLQSVTSLCLSICVSSSQVLFRWPHVLGPEEHCSCHKNPTWLMAHCVNRSSSAVFLELLFLCRACKLAIPCIYCMDRCKSVHSPEFNHLSNRLYIHWRISTLHQVSYQPGSLKQQFSLCILEYYAFLCLFGVILFIFFTGRLWLNAAWWTILEIFIVCTLLGSVDDDRIVKFLELAGVVGNLN